MQVEKAAAPSFGSPGIPVCAHYGFAHARGRPAGAMRGRVHTPETRIDASLDAMRREFSGRE